MLQQSIESSFRAACTATQAHGSQPGRMRLFLLPLNRIHDLTDIIGFRYRISIHMVGEKRKRDASGHQDLYSGLIRLHILHHACDEPLFGLSMIEELARHGYKLSAGTMYPLLHTLERRGLLRSFKRREGKVTRRFYTATPAGRKALRAAKHRVRELFGELFEHE